MKMADYLNDFQGYIKPYMQCCWWLFFFIILFCFLRISTEDYLMLWKAPYMSHNTHARSFKELLSNAPHFINTVIFQPFTCQSTRSPTFLSSTKSAYWWLSNSFQIYIQFQTATEQYVQSGMIAFTLTFNVPEPLHPGDHSLQAGES